MSAQEVEVEALATHVAAMDCDRLVHAIRELDCGYPMDFTAEYLRGLPLERLRHLYLALCLRAKGKCA